MSEQLEIEQLKFWCPEQVIQKLKGENVELEGEMWFWFVIFNDNTCKIIGNPEMYGCLYRATMEGKINGMRHRPAVTPEISKLIMQFIEKENNA